MSETITTLPPLPPRPLGSHKGTFGTVGVIGGCAQRGATRMLGAPALVAMGAARAGCGLVRVAAPEPILDHALALAPAAVGPAISVGPDGVIDASAGAVVLDELAAACDAAVIGPGLGRAESVRQLVVRGVAREMLGTLRAWVLDADALNALSETREIGAELRTPCVLTPHPGEARRLMDALTVRGEPAGDDDQRRDACEHLARRLGAIVTLKGRRTVVSDGQRTWVCGRGHPCLATGGTGDVLAGVIASIIAQRTGDDLLIDVCRAVEIHALAGERWAHTFGADAGLDPRELAGLIPECAASMRAGDTPPKE